MPGLDTLLPSRIEHGGVFGELGTRGEQGVELSGLPQLIEPSECGQHLLPDVALDAHVVNDLQVFVPPGLLDSGKHRVAPSRDHFRTPRLIATKCE